MAPFETIQNENDDSQHHENNGFLSSDDYGCERDGIKVAKLASNFGVSRKKTFKHTTSLPPFIPVYFGFKLIF